MQLLFPVQEQRLKELTTTTSSSTPAAASNPFTSQASPSAVTPTSSAARPSDDLLGLNSNPFADNVQSVMANAYSAPQPVTSNPFGAPPFQQQQTNGFATGKGETGTALASVGSVVFCLLALIWGISGCGYVGNHCTETCISSVW